MESKLKVLRHLVSEIAAIFQNGRHNRARRNLAWHYSYIYLFWYNVHVCQVSCFYHRMHDFPLICWAKAFYPYDKFVSVSMIITMKTSEQKGNNSSNE